MILKANEYFMFLLKFNKDPLSIIIIFHITKEVLNRLFIKVLLNSCYILSKTYHNL